MHGPAEELFDFLAGCLHDFLFDHDLIGTVSERARLNMETCNRFLNQK